MKVYNYNYNLDRYYYIYKEVPSDYRKTFKEVKKHAEKSLYRLNAKTSDIYTFSLTGKDFIGGWDWINNIVDPQDYLYNLKDKKFYKRISECVLERN